MSSKRPLVLDVDGTFLRTDMLFECMWAGLGKDPLRTLKAIFNHFRRPEVLKRELVEIAGIRTDLLPVNAEVENYAREAQEAGREVLLASASDELLVEELAVQHHMSDRVFASNPERNLKGSAKAEALVEAYGEEGFDYAGNAPVDGAIWNKSAGAVIVGDMPRRAHALEAAGKEVTNLGGGWRFKDLMRALRPHQWVKNVLLLVALVSAHAFAWQAGFMVLLGIAAFSMAASCIYIVNDLLDLEADRLHPTKHKRPFASGAVPIQVGMVTCIVLGLLAVGIGFYVGLGFLAVVVTYMTLSLAYSLRLKRLRWVDIATLATLYTLRVVAGALAVDVFVSTHLIVFIFPTFLALGCVKRLTEVTLAQGDERLPGRGYGKPDRQDLLNVAGVSAFGAVVIFILYSFSEQGVSLYPTKWLLWVAAIPLALWLVRMIRLGYLGEQDYDPIVFAMRDKRGIGLILMMLERRP